MQFQPWKHNCECCHFVWHKTGIIIKCYSFMCHLSKLKHIAHYKAKNQSTVKTNFHTHPVNRLAWRGEISMTIGKRWVCLMISLCKWDCSRKMVQVKTILTKQVCAHLIRWRQGMEVSEEENSWWVGMCDKSIFSWANIFLIFIN